MTIDTSKLEAVIGQPLTEVEVTRAVKDLARRIAYNKRPDVKAARKSYNQRRQQTIKLALEVYRKAKGGAV